MLTPSHILPVIADAINARTAGSPLRVSPAMEARFEFPESFGSVSFSTATEEVPRNMTMRLAGDLTLTIRPELLLQEGDVAPVVAVFQDALALALSDLLTQYTLSLPAGTAHVLAAWPDASPVSSPVDIGWEVQFTFILIMQF